MSGTTEPIVVAGMGVVGAAGVGSEPLLAQLVGGEPRTAPVDRSEGYHHSGSAALAALVQDLEVSRWIPPLEARRLSFPSKLAVIAARQASADAGLARPEGVDYATSVAIATAFGPAAWTQGLLDQILVEGPAAASPVLFTESVLNAPAGRLALALNAGGPSHTLSQGEAGALLAVARGGADLALGRARTAMVGSVEEITPLLHAILDRFRALARPADGLDERPRPFGAHRNGFLAAEGSTILVLRRARDLAAAGRPPLARLRAWHAAFDPTAPRTGWGRGEEHLAHDLERFLESACGGPSGVDLVVSCASGSVAGDRLEAAVLRRLWPQGELPPILVPKAVTGEYGGGFLAAAVLAAAGRLPSAPPLRDDPDPALRLAPHQGALPPVPGTVLVSSLAAGGAAAWLLLEAP